MSSLSVFGWILLSLLTEELAQMEVPQCALGPAESSHPVQGLLERFEAGPGCSARESGPKETHVIAVGRASNGPENKVTVLLTPLFFSPGPLREIYLLLSSKKPVIWCLEGYKLPPQLTVIVQVSSKSTVQPNSLEVQVQTMHSLPFRPRALHRWALRHHGNITSLTYSAHSNRVYIKLGQDQNQTTACHLQSVFLSHNYMISDLQPQEVQGCSLITAGAVGPFDPEVHIIKLYSAGSGLCGSLQVEVEVSLIPSVKSRVHNIVLILSSSVPVNWAIGSRGIQGHVDIYSSNSISPPFPPEPNLTVSSKLDAGLSTVSDLLLWARDRGYSTITSYTEADLANRFRVHLTRPGTEVSPRGGRATWVEEQRLRQWLSDSDVEDGESFTVHCNDGRLSVTMDQSIRQRLSVPVAAVTLRDPKCQAQSNGSHFLLVFPVISCQTEGDLLGHSGGVQYKNTLLEAKQDRGWSVHGWETTGTSTTVGFVHYGCAPGDSNDPGHLDQNSAMLLPKNCMQRVKKMTEVLLWRDEPPTLLELNETERRSKGPLSIHFTCLAPALALNSNDDGVGGSPSPVMGPWTPQGSKSEEQRKRSSPKHKPGPELAMRLFVSEKYEEKRIGPCVITAEHRVYTEISAKEPLVEVIEVKSCIISPQSDPKKSPFWSVIWDGCSSDDSLILGPIIKHDNGSIEVEHMEKDVRFHESRPGRSKRDSGWTEKRRASEEERTLRFSFIMRALFNESMQFLHCSLLLCGFDMTAGVSKALSQDCQTGTRIPPLVSTATTRQCEIRNLSRPMVVTRPISSLAPKSRLPPAGQRFKRLSVSPLKSPDPEHINSMVQIGPLLAIMFTAFLMGTCLMGGLWYIYSHTGPTPPREDDTMGGHGLLNPSSQSIQSNSSV